MQNHRLFIILVIILSITCVATVDAQKRSSKVELCNPPESLGISFKVVEAGRTIKDPILTGIRIVVKDGYNSVEDMRRLAQALEKTFCNEDRVIVNIFDDEKVARRVDSITDFLRNRKAVPELRGFYYFEKLDGKRTLSFSRRRGNSPEEVVVDF